MMTYRHKLKTVAEAYDAIEARKKRFEVRKNDRMFQTGDIVVLQRLDLRGISQPKEMTFRIGWILQGGQFGIEPGYCVFQLEEMDPRHD
jgi:hypothetical protein